MLIDRFIISKILTKYNIKITGALHVGAHECEERDFYQSIGLQDSDVYWIDALEEKVTLNRDNGIPNIYQGVISDCDDKDVEFLRTNNNQSSSILELDTHLRHHPGIHVVEKRKLQTTTLDTFVERHSIPIEKCNFWNFDIQGAELLALKGGIESLQHARVLYLEVNEEHLYKDCGSYS